MALPAGRYGVTKNQLLKIKKLPMNTIKLIEELTEKFDLLGTAAFKNSTSVVTQSTDLVESGAVENIIGWGNKNLAKGVENGTWQTASQTKANASNRGRVTDIIAVKSSTDYTVSAKALSGKTIQFILQFYSGLGSDTFISETSWSASPFTFTTPANCKYIAFIFRTSSNDENPENYVDEVQFELGSTATAYEPYHANIVNTLREAEVIEGKNQLQNKGTSSGIFTVNSDGTITANGTPTSQELINLGSQSGFNGNYILTGLDTTFPIGSYITVRKNDVWTNLYIRPNELLQLEFNLISTDVMEVFCVVSANTNIANKVFKPMLRKATETDPTYEPYYIPLKDVVPTKADNSVIGTVEDGANPTKAYAVGEHMIRNGKFCTVTVAVTTSSTWTLGSNYVEGTIAEEFYVSADNTSLLTAETGVTLNNVFKAKVGNIVAYTIRFLTTEDKANGASLISGMDEPIIKLDGVYAGVMYLSSGDFIKVAFLVNDNVVRIKTLDAIPSGVSVRGTIVYMSKF